MVEACLKLLELGYFEVKCAFEGLADENVWKRPAPGLLSVGELAGHIAFWEAVRLAGEGPDPAKCGVRSPLIDARFRYYPATIATPPSEEHRAMTAEQVCREVLRVHAEALAQFKALNPDANARIPGCPTGFTYGEYLQYAVFHLAYHTGQMYSARHLLGEEPPDN
jgi:DinB superfamily